MDPRRGEYCVDLSGRLKDKMHVNPRISDGKALGLHTDRRGIDDQNH